MEIILTTKNELQSIVKGAIKEHEKEISDKIAPKLYTINQIAKKLGKAHATIKKMVTLGSIKTTNSGLITEKAINEYLNNIS